jgi:hypothetical protein
VFCLARPQLCPPRVRASAAANHARSPLPPRSARPSSPRSPPRPAPRVEICCTPPGASQTSPHQPLPTPRHHRRESPSRAAHACPHPRSRHQHNPWRRPRPPPRQSRRRTRGSMAPTGDVALAPFNTGDVALPTFPTGSAVADPWRPPETSPLPPSTPDPSPLPLQHQIDRTIHPRVLHLPRLPSYSLGRDDDEHSSPSPPPPRPTRDLSLAPLQHQIDRTIHPRVRHLPRLPKPFSWLRRRRAQLSFTAPPRRVWPLHHPTVDSSILPTTPMQRSHLLLPTSWSPHRDPSIAAHAKIEVRDPRHRTGDKGRGHRSSTNR